MGQRNRSVDLEMEQQQQQQQHQSQPSLQPGPCLLLGSSFPQPVNNNIPAMVPNSLQDNSAMFYGLPPYHHHPQPALTNYYAPYVAFQAPPSQLPTSSIHERNAHFVDHTPGAYKMKNAEGIPVNPHLAGPFINTPEAVVPFGGARNIPGAVTMNPVLPPPPHVPHAPNGFIQGNYAGHHPYPPPGSIWYDQHHGRPDGPPSFWPHLPYMQGSNIVPGSIEPSSRNPAPFMYSPQLNREQRYYHPPPPPVQGVRGQSAMLYPPMASSPSFRVPFGNFGPQNTISTGPVQPMAFRLYQHHQQDDPPPLGALRQHRGGVPRLRVMPDDEVAMLEFGDFLGNNHVDHHRDMRLDIEEMSYEELLALSERIGTVNTGLPEEDVKNHLKTRTCSVVNQAEESPSSPQAKDGETEPCTICQESFKNEEKIATLDCGHEYHVECLEKWLIVKNVCPICKSEALVMEKKNV